MEEGERNEMKHQEEYVRNTKIMLIVKEKNNNDGETTEVK